MLNMLSVIVLVVLCDSCVVVFLNLISLLLWLMLICLYSVVKFFGVDGLLFLC